MSRPTTVSPGVGPSEMPAPTFRLYSLGAMILGTFLGSMFVGLLLISRNFKALGDEDRAHRSFWLGVGGTVAVFAAAFTLPKEVPGGAYEAVQIGVVTWYANREQGKMIEEHKTLGGRFYSKWRAVGIGLIVTVAILLVLFCAVELGILKV